MTDVRVAWYALTHQGNACFTQGHFREAVRQYRLARDLSIQHIDEWPDPEAAVTAVVVSFLNLVEGLIRIGSLEEAAENLCLIHENLLLASIDDEQCLDLRQAARLRTRETLAAIHHFIQHHGTCPAIATLLDLDQHFDTPGCCSSCGLRPAVPSSASTLH